jgi:RNA-directed DNA polymerase
VFRAHIVNYADDFVILSQRNAVEALAWTKAVMTKLGLTLNEVKTSVKDARTERFDFLGYTFGPHCYQRNGKRYLGASPSAKSIERAKTKVSDVLVPGNMQPWPEVCDRLNSLLRGRSATSAMAHEAGHTGRLITTSASASDTSSVGGIRFPVAGPNDSQVA